MRKKIFLFVLIIYFAISFVSAVNVDMKTDLKKGETIIAKVTGVFLEDIEKEDIHFYRRHLPTSIDPYDILKINETFYIYGKISTSKIADNYSLQIKNVPHMIGPTWSSEDIIKNFTISEEIAEFSIYPGALTVEEDYSFEVQNLQPSTITIEISEDENNWFFSWFGSNSFEVELYSGEIKQIGFNLENQTKLKKIFFESENTEYNTTVYNIYNPSTGCLDNNYYCVEDNECSGNIISAYECSGDLICCDEPSTQNLCQDKGYYCVEEGTCSGNIINNYECSGTGLICCDEQYISQEPEYCEDKEYYCMPNSACYGNILEQYECSGFFVCCSIPANQPPSAYCGDGTCNENENCTICPEDCGECSIEPYCGDGIKDKGEKCDLGEMNGVVCDNSESDCAYCSEDCVVVKLEKQEDENFWEKVFGKKNKTLENSTNISEDEEPIVVDDEIIKEEEARLKTCEELKGKVCEEEQKCDSREVYAKDALCCLGECKEIKESNTGKTIGWVLLGAVALIIIYIFKKKSSKKKKPVNFLSKKK